MSEEKTAVQVIAERWADQFEVSDGGGLQLESQKRFFVRRGGPDSNAIWKAIRVFDEICRPWAMREAWRSLIALSEGDTEYSDDGDGATWKDLEFFSDAWEYVDETIAEHGLSENGVMGSISYTMWRLEHGLFEALRQAVEAAAEDLPECDECGKFFPGPGIGMEEWSFCNDGCRDDWLEMERH
jgi:hypothetical protein